MSGRHYQERALFAPGAYPSFLDDPDADERACLGSPLEVWFAPGEVGRTAQVAKAKAMCRRCPLLARCEDWVMSRPQSEVYGIWAGMTEYERDQRRQAVKLECVRCRRTVKAIHGKPSSHMRYFAGGWVWCR